MQSDRDEFNAYLNKRYTCWEIEDCLIDAADALASQPEMYDEALRNWVAGRDDRQNKSVLDGFPSPIALRFGRFVNEKTAKKRLDCLRDSWEAIITLTAILAIAEVRHYHQDAAKCGVDQSKQLQLHNLRDAIDVLEKLYEHGIGTPFLSSITDAGPALFADLEVLKDERNELHHGETPNSSHALTMLERCEPLVRSVLSRLEPLEEVTLFSYLEPSDEIEEGITVRTYTGRVTELSTTDFVLEENDRIAIVSRPAPHSDVYARYRTGPPICLSPLLCWYEPKHGDHRYLGYLDQVSTEDSNKRFRYRIYGDSGSSEKESKKLSEDWDTIRRPFRGKPTPSKNQQQKAAADERRAEKSKKAKKTVRNPRIKP